MSFSNGYENAILLLIFNATAIADIAQNDGSSPATDLAVALHTADPGEGGGQDTNEAAYTSYARVNVARSGAGWVVTGNSVSPAADVEFPECTGSPGSDITHFSVGIPGGNTMITKGPLSPAIVMAVGVIPIVDTGTTIVLD